MKRSKKFWITQICIAAGIGIALSAIAVLTCIILTHNSPYLHYGLKIMAILLFLSTGLWYMTIVLHHCDIKDAVKIKQIDAEHMQKQKEQSPYAASLYDLTDDEGGKTFFNLRGERIKAGETAGPVVTAVRMAAIISLMFTITICVYMICAVLNVIK